MRMLMNRSVRAPQAALNCIKRALRKLCQISRPRVVLVTDTPSFAKSILPNISEFAEVLHFDYKHFQGNISRAVNTSHSLDFRVKDWGPAPRWVARVGTTYAQLIAALAAANHLGENSNGSSFSFLSSFQSNLLADGLRLQVGWGHVWNRFAGPLSCKNQPNQCAFTPLLPPAWWDGLWQSPIPRDVRRLEAFVERKANVTCSTASTGPRWGAISKGTVETRFTSSSVVRDGPGDREAAIFTYKELSFATSSFRAESFLGSGGFGAVYKGKLESTGQVSSFLDHI
ncbi:hypothetical protein OIU77_016378 [Salix suchowensis]|uniref:Protein kinase domain-containing protein n=1 Tax=Salix suchowensis TaxID=1278906 RepID=A0ABQ8ZK65_9ROSI|nr:hypothetical protein OIU77_016378 [Salix suchowensis]